jgi:hypothetical protein
LTIDKSEGEAMLAQTHSGSSKVMPKQLVLFVAGHGIESSIGLMGAPMAATRLSKSTVDGLFERAHCCDGQ